MSVLRTSDRGQAKPERASDDVPTWVEIFKDRIAEDLKRVLQEDLDWTTSVPILERLNRLQDAEKARNEDSPKIPELRKAS